MFLNRYYLGEVQSKDSHTGETVWYPGKHEPMVDEETFEAVQITLQRRGFSHSKPSGESITYEKLLKEFLTCSKSGRYMFYDAKTRYTCGFCKYRYFSNVPKDCPKCSRKLDPKVVESAYKVRYYMSYPGFEHTYFHKGKQNTGRSIPAEYVESLIDAELAKLHISDELFEVLRKRLIYLWEEKRKEITQKKSKLRKEADKIQATIDRMLSEKWGGEGLSERNKEEIDRLVDEKR